MRFGDTEFHNEKDYLYTPKPAGVWRDRGSGICLLMILIDSDGSGGWRSHDGGWMVEED